MNYDWEMGDKVIHEECGNKINKSLIAKRMLDVFQLQVTLDMYIVPQMGKTVLFSSSHLCPNNHGE